jgi:RNA polymerase sigma factor (sigma-70 family)
LLLEHLLLLSQEARCATILEHGQADLVKTLQLLGRECTLILETMDAERLGWAIAFNVEGAPRPPILPAVSKRGAIQSYRDRWLGETQWFVIWSVLTKPLIRPNSGSSCLIAELALSVACEHRDDWQNPTARPINLQNAARSFEFVYRRDKSVVVGDVFQRFGERAGPPEGIADEAWSRVFCDYWSINAQRRFLGLSQISTFVCQVARYAALDEIRKRNRFVSIDQETDSENSTQADQLLINLEIHWDPTDRLIEKELLRLIKKCISELPARQRIVVEMIGFRNIRAKEVSKILRISEAAVSQHLKKAREALCICLRTYGYDVSA